MSAYKRVQQWATFGRAWHLFDCKWQDPYESAIRIGYYLCGLHKPIYHPLNDCGDIVVAINSRDIALRGDDWRKRAYFHHTGYPGGASWTPAWELHEKNPKLIIEKAVYRSLKKNLQRRYTMQRLLIFTDSNIPKEIMENISHTIKPLVKTPTRLDHISEKEIKEFPKILDYPTNYIIK